jgi:hypothetical protein
VIWVHRGWGRAVPPIQHWSNSAGSLMIEPEIGSVFWVQGESQRVKINGLL